MKKITIKVPKLKTRVLWGFNPISRVKESKKVYSRKKLAPINPKYILGE